MILETVHVPALYRLPAQDLDYVLCPQLIGLLSDTLRNCVILVDSKRQIPKAIADAVSGWPIRYRLRGMELVCMLWLHSRFVPVDVAAASKSGSSRTGPCELAVSIIDERKVPIVIPDTCACGMARCCESELLIPLGDYQISQFSKDRADAENASMSSPGTIRQKFEDAIWVPAIRHASRVTLLDRYIGRHVTMPNRSGRPALTLSPAYRNSMTWLFQTISRCQTQAVPKRVEIFTGIETHRAGAADRASAVGVLKQFFGGLSKTYGIQTAITVCGETKRRSFPHARWLITDQGQWIFERGFALLRSDGSVEDVSVTLQSFDAARRALAAVRSLPQL